MSTSEVSAEPAKPSVIGQVFGKYRIVRDLGAGGMAEVYLSSLDGPDGFSKSVVIKRILPEFARDEAFSAMFVNEAKVAAMMSHPNIVQVFEFAKEQEQYYLAMEYVNGASLTQLGRAASRARVPLGPRVGVEIGIGIGHALAYAHTFTLPDGRPLNLVHRDVSPGNILISREGTVKLADFGVVKSSMMQQVTVAGVVKGKWSYMSPEQLAGQPIDHRSDVFSLGIIVYEVATHRRLFKADSVPATVNLVLHGDIPAPGALVPGFPSRLEKIILKALSRVPDDRYQSAADFAADLEAFRVSQNWTAGGHALAALVTGVIPKEGFAQGATPGTDSSARGVSGSQGETAPFDFDVEVDMAQGVSVPGALRPNRNTAGAGVVAAVAAVAVALIGSALFWYFVL